jgi:hypothetical protein
LIDLRSVFRLRFATLNTNGLGGFSTAWYGSSRGQRSNRVHTAIMSATSLRRAITSTLVGLLAVHSSWIPAMTGGVPVDEILAAPAGSRFTQQQVAFARAVSSVTVALVVSDASGKPGALCSATIVHPRVALTAAHCVLNVRNDPRRIAVLFDRAASRRQALDVIIHPGFLKNVRDRAPIPGDHRREHARTEIDFLAISKDLALVLLHRSIPEGYDVVAPVPRGFHDRHTATKLIAGYGTVGASRSMDRLSLRFAELLGNSRLDEGGITGGSEIIMLSKYLNGARVNACSGDSGGPILVLEKGASRLRQLAVTSAADEDCREAAIFASIDAERAALRSMFDALMQGEVGADLNPF